MSLSFQLEILKVEAEECGVALVAVELEHIFLEVVVEQLAVEELLGSMESKVD